MATSVLIFESDAVFANELTSEFSGLGCDVRVVEDGNAGLQMAASSRPDLILLSIELPRMNGFSVCNKLKKDPNLKEIPLIIVSSESSDETFEQHKRLRTRAEDYIHKPISAADLIHRVQQTVGFIPPSSTGADDAIIIDDEIFFEDDESQPVAMTRSVTSPKAVQPVVGHPTQPAVRQPAVRQPVLPHPPVAQPVVPQPVVHQPVGHHPVVPQPTGASPVAPRPTASRLAATRPSASSFVVPRTITARVAATSSVPSHPAVTSPVAPRPTSTLRNQPLRSTRRDGDVSDLDVEGFADAAFVGLFDASEHPDASDSSLSSCPPSCATIVRAPQVQSGVIAEGINDGDIDAGVAVVATSHAAGRAAADVGGRSNSSAAVVDPAVAVAASAAPSATASATASAAALAVASNAAELERVRQELSRVQQESDHARAEHGKLQKELTESRSDIRRLEGQLISAAEMSVEAERLRRQVEDLKARPVTIAPRGGVATSRELLDLREALNKKDKEILGLRDEISRRDKDLLDLRDASLALEREKADSNDRIMELESQVMDIQMSMERVIGEREAGARKISELQRQLDQSVALVAVRDGELVTAEERRVSDLKQLQERLEASQAIALEAQTAESDKVIAGLNAEKDELTTRGSWLTSQLAERDARISVLEVDNERNLTRIEKLEGNVDERDDRISTLEDDKTGLKLQIEERDGRISGLEADKTRLEGV
ncbi:MAG: response regulator, partial [Polyangiaceae bacterium]|nr:response regulator [Polyangiaceae bacterium]